MHEKLIQEIKNISFSMFSKNFFGIYHGSISARTESEKFIINTKDAMFDMLEDEDLIELGSKKDYRWKDASIDAKIHYNIYKNIKEAKYICYTLPMYIMALSFIYDKIEPLDFFGIEKFPYVEVYQPESSSSWSEVADYEISRYFKTNKTNIMVIKGYGVYMHSRSLISLAKDIAVLENSAKMICLKNDKIITNLSTIV